MGGSSPAGSSGADESSWSVSQVAPFIEKTYEMINKEDNGGAVKWSESGKSFTVCDVAGLESVLSRYFKHNRLASFERQLHTYGFRKLRRPKTLQGSNEEAENPEFWHKHFLRDEPDKLVHIRRNERRHNIEALLAELESLTMKKARLEHERDNLRRANVQLMQQSVAKSLLYAPLSSMAPPRVLLQSGTAQHAPAYGTTGARRPHSEHSGTKLALAAAVSMLSDAVEVTNADLVPSATNAAYSEMMERFSLGERGKTVLEHVARHNERTRALAEIDNAIRQSRVWRMMIIVRDKDDEVYEQNITLYPSVRDGVLERFIVHRSLKRHRPTDDSALEQLRTSVLVAANSAPSTFLQPSRVGKCDFVTLVLSVGMLLWLDKVEVRKAIVALTSVDAFMFHVWDHGGHWQYISPNCSRIIGFEQAELLGTCGYHNLHPTDIDRLQATRQRIALDGTRGTDWTDLRFRRKRADNSFVWLECLGGPMYPYDSIVSFERPMRAEEVRRCQRKRAAAHTEARRGDRPPHPSPSPTRAREQR